MISPLCPSRERLVPREQRTFERPPSGVVRLCRLLRPQDFPPFATPQRYCHDWSDPNSLKTTNHHLVAATPKAQRRKVGRALASSTARSSRPRKAAAQAPMLARKSKAASATSPQILLIRLLVDGVDIQIATNLMPCKTTSAIAIIDCNMFAPIWISWQNTQAAANLGAPDYQASDQKALKFFRENRRSPAPMPSSQGLIQSTKRGSMDPRRKP